MLRMAVFSLMIVSLTGCGIRARVFGTRAEPDREMPFSTSIDSGQDGRDFTVTARRAANAGFEAARGSLHYGATAYCIQNYGGPDIDWATDPGSGDWVVTRTGDGLTVSGRCTFR